MSEASVLGRGGLPKLRRRWGIVVAVSVLAGLGGYVFAITASPSYEASVRLLVGPISTDFETLRAAGQLAHTYSELARSQPLLAATLDELGRTETPRELREAIRTIANDVTRIITIEARSGDAASAAMIANTLAANLVKIIPSTSGPEGTIRVVEPATPPIIPVWPRTSLIVSLAALGGFLGALTAVVIVEYIRDALGTH